MEDLLSPLTWLTQLGIHNRTLPLGRKLMVQSQNICLFLVFQIITDNFKPASKVQETKFSIILFPKDELNFLDLVLCDRKAVIYMTCEELVFRPLNN